MTGDVGLYDFVNDFIVAGCGAWVHTVHVPDCTV